MPTLDFMKEMYNNECTQFAPKQEADGTAQLRKRVAELEACLATTLKGVALLQARTHSLERSVDKQPILAFPGITLEKAEELRAHVWSQPFQECDDQDWDPITGTYPARTNGTCRHKAHWLRKEIGGRVIYGKRIDKRDAGFHAALLVRIDNKNHVIDCDKIWPADKHPFREEVHQHSKLGQPSVIEQLFHRIDQLEKRPQLKYVGVWQDGVGYLEGECCTHQGSMWYAHTSTKAKPGTSHDWQLCVKKGKDASSPREGAAR
jgi:hypothetical protein